MDNEAFARSITPLETYDRIIEVYEGRSGVEPYRKIVETCKRQAALKRAEMAETSS